MLLATLQRLRKQVDRPVKASSQCCLIDRVELHALTSVLVYHSVR
jgi:hypothetical protein